MAKQSGKVASIAGIIGMRVFMDEDVNKTHPVFCSSSRLDAFHSEPYNYVQSKNYLWYNVSEMYILNVLVGDITLTR